MLSEKVNVRFQGPKQGSDMLCSGVDPESSAKENFILVREKKRKTVS